LYFFNTLLLGAFPAPSPIQVCAAMAAATALAEKAAAKQQAKAVEAAVKACKEETREMALSWRDQADATVAKAQVLLPSDTLTCTAYNTKLCIFPIPHFLSSAILSLHLQILQARSEAASSQHEAHAAHLEAQLAHVESRFEVLQMNPLPVTACRCAPYLRKHTRRLFAAPLLESCKYAAAAEK
jgi:hypothetical protein